VVTQCLEGKLAHKNRIARCHQSSSNGGASIALQVFFTESFNNDWCAHVAIVDRTPAICLRIWRCERPNASRALETGSRRRYGPQSSEPYKAVGGPGTHARTLQERLADDAQSNCPYCRCNVTMLTIPKHPTFYRESESR
jgi:hypothetical protein